MIESALTVYEGAEPEIRAKTVLYGTCATIMDGGLATIVFPDSSVFVVSPLTLVYIRDPGRDYTVKILPQHREITEDILIPTKDLVDFTKGKALEEILDTCETAGFSKELAARCFRWWEIVIELEKRFEILTKKNISDAWDEAKR